MANHNRIGTHSNAQDATSALRDRLTTPVRPRRRRRSAWSLVVWLVPAIAVFVAVFLLTGRAPIYEAEGSLIVTFGREYVFNPVAGNSGSWDRWGSEEALNSELEILNSRDIQAAVIRFIGPDRILHPTARQSEPSPGGALAPAPLRRLLGLLAEELRAVDLLNPKADPFDKARAAFSEALMIKSAAKSSSIRLSFRSADPELARAVIDKLMALYLAKRLKIYGGPQPTELAGLIENRRLALQSAAEKMSAFTVLAGVANFGDEVAALSSRKAGLAEELDRIDRALADVMAQRAARDKNSIEPELAVLRDREKEATAGLIASRAVAATQLDRVEHDIAVLEARRDEFAILQEQVDAARAAYGAILEQDAVAQVNVALDAKGLGNVKVLMPAVTPSVPAGVPPLTMVMIAAAIGLLASLGLHLGLWALTDPSSSAPRRKTDRGLRADEEYAAGRNWSEDQPTVEDSAEPDPASVGAPSSGKRGQRFVAAVEA